MTYKQPPVLGCLLVGENPTKIIVRGTTYQFEMLRGCGPAFVNKDGSEKTVPKYCWKALDYWSGQGERIVNGEAVWVGAL